MELVLQQCLHGYDDGHELLAASLKTTKRDGYLLDLLSDLSGQNAPRDSSAYLTGYPLADSNFYVIASTWLAHELPRPGCAWTHSLLVEFGDLPSIADAAQLIGLFTRPKLHNGKLDRKPYTTPITMPVGSPGASDQMPQIASTKVLTEVVNALYTKPSKKLFVIPQSGQDYENLALRIWSQQWPKLRRSFRFCTRSLQDRSDRDTFFDLQILATRQHHIAIDSSSDSVVVGIPDRQTSSEMESWVQLAVDDLVIPSASAFRSFLSRYGSETTGNRGTFALLAKIFQELTRGGSSDIGRAIELLDDRSGEKSEWKTLRRHILSRPLDPELPLPPLQALVVLAFCLEHPRMIRGPDGEIVKKLAEHAWATGFKGQVLELLSSVLDETTNTTAKAISGFAPLLTDSDLNNVVVSYPQLLGKIIGVYPELVSKSDVWRANDEVLNQIFSSLGGSANLDASIIRSAAGLALEYNRPEAVSFLLLKYTVPTVFGVLDHVDANSSTATSSTRIQNSEALARGLLDGCGDTAIRWVDESTRPTAQGLAVVMDTISYDQGTARKADLSKWLPLAGAIHRDESERGLALQCVLLLMAFHSEGWNAAEIAKNTFEPVHRAIEEDRLPWQFWVQFRGILPKLSWRRSWDKAERLRQGLLDRFIKNGWPSDHFFQIITTQRVLDGVFHPNDLEDRHEKFLGAISKELRKGTLKASSEQRLIVESSRYY